MGNLKCNCVVPLQVFTQFVMYTHSQIMGLTFLEFYLIILHLNSCSGYYSYCRILKCDGRQSTYVKLEFMFLFCIFFLKFHWQFLICYSSYWWIKNFGDEYCVILSQNSDNIDTSFWRRRRRIKWKFNIFVRVTISVQFELNIFNKNNHS